MRLTLRTMLAYLDREILLKRKEMDPADAAELGQKIQESEFATGLAHRIQNAMHRPKLDVPSLEGKGMGLDPNTVAEYLDSVLPPDRVPDFERICLESDVQLAEVAASHQILTWILDREAEIDPAVRHRMYLLGAPDTKRKMPSPPAAEAPPGVEATAPPVAADAAVASPPVGATVEPRRALEVPDYLRAGQPSKFKPLVISLALAFLVSVIVLRIMGPFNRQHPLVLLFGGSGAAQVVQNETPGDHQQSTPEGTTAGTLTATPETGKPAGEVTAPDSSKPAPSESGTGATSPAGTSTVAPDDKPTDPPHDPDVPEKPGEKTPADSSPAEKVTTKPAEQAPEVRPDVKVEPAPESQPAAPAVEPAVDVGYVKFTEGQFLLRRGATATDWIRVPARNKLSSGDRLKILPTYRPEIVLAPSTQAAGVQIKFVGASEVTLLRPTSQGEPALLLSFGRALLSTAGVAGARLQLDFGGIGGIVTFADAATEVAIDVGRFARPGVDPEREPAQIVIHLLPMIGRITWQSEGSDAAIPLSPGQTHVMFGDRTQTLAVPESPAWLSGDQLSDIDRLASRTLEPILAEGKSVSLTLQERTQDRKSEIRSLSARCLAFLDSYDAITAEFNDDRQRSYWSVEYDSLLEAVARHPQSASQVRETFERLTGANAETLYRMLWSYSPQQLQEGEAEMLVRSLDNAGLNVRVFAFENLRRITGKTLSYRPEATDARRKSMVQDWMERLNKGEIIYSSLPTPSPFGT